MQLYSFEQAKSQPLEAHAAAFSMVKVRRDLPDDRIPRSTPTALLCGCA